MSDEIIEPPTSLQVLNERAPLGWLRERDIDLLLCAELHGNSTLQAWLAEHTGRAEASFSGAWVSLAEREGESDLVVVFETAAGHRVLLIENKIAAAFQPEQAERYQARAARWRDSRDVGSACTLLLAPAAYLDRPGATTFDIRLSYEDLAAVLRHGVDRRSLFLAEALDAAIATYRRRSVSPPDPAVSAVWIAIWQQACEVAPRLRLREPTPRPGQSNWITCSDADGFSNEHRGSAMLIFKAERGQVDLQFGKMTVPELEALIGDRIDADMAIVRADNSASIRVAVPAIAFMETAEGQEGPIRQGLLECERLRRFFVEQDLSLRLRNRS